MESLLPIIGDCVIYQGHIDRHGYAGLCRPCRTDAHRRYLARKAAA